MNTRTLCFGFFITATIGLGLSALLPADDQRGALKKGNGDATSPDADAYRSFAGKRAGQERDDNGLKMKFVWCLLGSFRMGPIQIVDGKQVNENQEIEDLQRRLNENDRVAEPPEEELDEDDLDGRVENATKVDGRSEQIGPPRDNRVFFYHGYWLGQYEVKRAEWKQLMGTAPWENRKIVVQGDDFPATYVSLNDATEFCRRLTDQVRKAGRLPDGWVYTLPTEAQWERACRAQTATRYSFGDDPANLHEYGWFNENTAGQNEPYPHRVGQKRPNPWGLYDMHGNVVEWCRDSWGTPPGGLEPEVNEGAEKVQRGGQWNTPKTSCGSGGRFTSQPGVRKLEFGFRVACSYAAPTEKP